MNALDAAFRFHETALRIGGQRQQVIASNMANADTPRFQAREVRFADALAHATGETGATRAGAAATVSRVVMTTSRPGHVDPGHGPGAVVLSTTDLAPREPTQPSIDGNTVDLDAERAAFADNTVRYEASYAFLNHQIKQLMSAINN